MTSKVKVNTFTAVAIHFRVPALGLSVITAGTDCFYARTFFSPARLLDFAAE